MDVMQTDLPAVLETTCCVVGGGPAGVMLAYLLARQGIDVTLLEAHLDFDREFRGDTLHPAAMELLDELGLAERLLQLRHAKVTNFSVPVATGAFTFNVFASLKTKFPYITVMAQSQFLAFVVKEAQRYPNFHVHMGAHVDQLIQIDGVVHGVSFRGADGLQSVVAKVTVGADGRFSQVRKLAGGELIKTSSSIDVLWFRLSRKETDPSETLGVQTGKGLFIIQIDRFDYWQVGIVILKGGYQHWRSMGLAHLRETLASIVPAWADRVEELTDWKQISVLSVESSRLKRWHQPGLLFIGDAAHVMSPVGGVGINYAIQDAVVASNVLAEKLKAGIPVLDRDLAQVQRQRELPIRVVQAFQSRAQNVVSERVLSDQRPQTFTVPAFLLPVIKIPWLLAPAARMLGFGLCPPHLNAMEA